MWRWEQSLVRCTYKPRLPVAGIDFPDGPVAKTSSSQCRGPGCLIPGQGTRSHMLQLRPGAAKKKKNLPVATKNWERQGTESSWGPFKKNQPCQYLDFWPLELGGHISTILSHPICGHYSSLRKRIYMWTDHIVKYLFFFPRESNHIIISISGLREEASEKNGKGWTNKYPL